MKDALGPRRDHTMDVVRGIAIVTMVGANLASLLPEPHSMALRYYSSFAAPIFVSLAGSMMALAVDRSCQTKHPFSYFALRGLFLVGIGALIDILAWNFIPFLGFDVLYLLGISLPLLFLSAFLPVSVLVVLSVTVFTLTPALQSIFGYSPVPLVLSLSDWSVLSTRDVPLITRHWLIDGWFPLFPWLGYGLMGIVIGKWRWHSEASIRYFNTSYPVGFTLILLVVGATVMAQYPGPLYSRVGFSELFYPAQLGFITLSVGVVIGLVALVDWLSWMRIWELFRVYGEATLFMYTIHSLIVGMIIAGVWAELSPGAYWALYASLIVFLGGCGMWLRTVRKKNPKSPVLVKWIVGG